MSLPRPNWQSKSAESTERQRADPRRHGEDVGRQSAERTTAILREVELLLTEQQELVRLLNTLDGLEDEASVRKRDATLAHMQGHATQLERLLNELDALTGRAN